MLQAQCELDVADAAAVAEKICEQYREHGSVTRRPDGGTVSILYGQAELSAAGGALAVRLQAPDETDLTYMKMGLAHYIRAFAGSPEPTIRWSGDGAVGSPLPFFREMTVVRALDLTPRIRRLILAGNDLQRFASGGLHIRLAFAPAGREPQWPVLGEDGCPLWPGGADGLHLRVYTIRAVDPARGELTVDMVRHAGNDMPGARFAETARPGDTVGILGPSGRSIPSSEQVFLIGDETAIPAIARILEAMPAEASARALIEVEDAREQQRLSSQATLEIEWLHRGPRALSARAVEMLQAEAVGDTAFVWAGCEFSDFKAIRRHCRASLKLPRERHLVAAYWRRGQASVG